MYVVLAQWMPAMLCWSTIFPSCYEVRFSVLGKTISIISLHLMCTVVESPSLTCLVFPSWICMHLNGHSWHSLYLKRFIHFFHTWIYIGRVQYKIRYKERNLEAASFANSWRPCRNGVRCTSSWSLISMLIDSGTQVFTSYENAPTGLCDWALELIASGDLPVSGEFLLVDNFNIVA